MPDPIMARPPRLRVISITDAREKRLVKDEQPMTIGEIATHFGVSTRTITRWIGDGMPHVRPFEHGLLRFSHSTCDTWFRGLRRSDET